MSHSNTIYLNDDLKALGEECDRLAHVPKPAPINEESSRKVRRDINGIMNFFSATDKVNIAGHEIKMHPRAYDYLINVMKISDSCSMDIAIQAFAEDLRLLGQCCNLLKFAESQLKTKSHVVALEAERPV